MLVYLLLRPDSEVMLVAIVVAILSAPATKGRRRRRRIWHESNEAVD
jgi:hypothetical protein